MISDLSLIQLPATKSAQQLFIIEHLFECTVLKANVAKDYKIGMRVERIEPDACCIHVMIIIILSVTYDANQLF